MVRLSRLYLLEGLVMTAVAVALAPFLATGLVAAAGFLPAFSDLDEPGLLPVELQALPFVVAGVIGAVCLIIYVVPGVLGARGGLLAHKLRSSRPPSVPMLHRYFLDVVVLVAGGLIFWEMHARGHVISGGLLKDVEVNEALLIAPVLFLIAVALLFMRLFPLLVRYVTGESPQVVHLHVDQPALARLPQQALRQNGLDHAGEDRDHVNAHARPPTLQLSRSRSSVRRKPAAPRRTFRGRPAHRPASRSLRAMAPSWPPGCRAPAGVPG